MPITTKAVIASLGTTRKLKSRQFTALYSTLSEHAIRKAYSMVRVYRALEANPSWRPANVRRTDKHGWEQTRLHHKTASKAISDAKKYLRNLSLKQQRKQKPP